VGVNPRQQEQVVNTIPRSSRVSGAYIDGGNLIVTTRATYLELMAQDGVWGGEPELLAYSHHRPVVLLDSTAAGDDQIVLYQAGVRNNVTDGAHIPANAIFLLHTPGHYRALRRRA
jgi:hypothetical protein